MANKKTTKNKKASKRSSLKLSSQIKWQRIIIFALVFGLVGGLIIFKSFAAGTPHVVNGYMDWPIHTLTVDKYTPSVKSLDSQLCVITYFNDYGGLLPLVNGSYKWYAQEYQSGSWVTTRDSQNFTSNGNRDHQCFNAGIEKDHTYRVKFHVNRFDGGIHGNYAVFGYYKE